MDDILFMTLTGGALVLFAALVAGLLVAWRRGMRDDGPLPFFRKLEASGLSVPQAEEAIGLDGISRAVRRCAFCGAKEACRGSLRSRLLRSKPVDCPNEQLFERMKGTSEEARP